MVHSPQAKRKIIGSAASWSVAEELGALFTMVVSVGRMDVMMMS